MKYAENGIVYDIDVTWEYVMDIHEPDHVWRSLQYLNYKECVGQSKMVPNNDASNSKSPAQPLTTY
jgi:hypothetical protein